MYQSESAPWLWFRAWATDGSAKTDLVYNTSGISIKVARDNQADSSALSLSAASSPTDWAAGKFLQVIGNLYKVGIATASISSYTGAIAICGSYTGGTIEGVIDHVSAYNPAGNPNTTTPPTAAQNADAVWDEARSGHVTTGTFGDKVNAELDSAALRSALGMSAADLDDQLDAILAAATAAAGTGARTVTVTVNDGTTVLQNAVVRFTEGSNTYRALTNASGVATFNLDDATYTVAVSKVGYYYAGTTMIVNGTETATYSMSAINVTPGTGDLTTGYLTCLDEEGVAEEGVAVRCQFVQVPASGTGFAYDSAVQLETSDSDGLVEFPMIKGARYLVWRGSIKPPQGITPVLISASAGSTTALGSLIGE